MTISEQTLSKIQSLAHLYQTGYSSKTVDVPYVWRHAPGKLY